MISLNAQIGVNPLITHNPKLFYSHALCNNQLTIGQSGEIVGWRNKQPIFLMCPSLNAEADKLLCITAAKIRDIDQINQTVKIITLHNDQRLRIWTENDGICINVSSPAIFPEKIIQLIAPLIQCRFIIALAQEAFYIVDCWVLKIIQKITPKKQSYARFKYGQITQQLTLEIYDGNNRAYNYQLSQLFSQHFLDFGNELTDFNKILNQIQGLCNEISKREVSSYYKRLDKLQQKNNAVTESYQNILNAIKAESLSSILFTPQMLKDYEKLSSLFQGEEANISDLHYVGGTSLYFFVGTKKGTIFGIPISIRSNESLIIVKDARKHGFSVEYIRIFNYILFISWSDGSLGIYSVKNLQSQLQIIKINKFLQQKDKQKQNKIIDICTMDLKKLTLLQQKLSSFMKYSLPAYDCIEGKIKASYFFRLDRNEIICYNETTNSIAHYRGISQDAKVYCIFLMNEYVGICTSNGIEMYSSLQYQRTIGYNDWQWQDYKFLQSTKNVSQYRHSDYNDFIKNANSIMKYNCRWVFDKLDYISYGQQIFNQTFGNIQSLTNQQYANYYFLQRGQVKKALHSRNSQHNAIVIKIKLNRIRKDRWNNAAYIINANLNLELDQFQLNKGLPRQILLKDYQLYMLLPCNDLNVPFISNQLKNIGKRICLKKRQAIQGVGKSFTVYFTGSNRIKLSQKLLINEAVSTIAMLHCWVSKQNEATDYMIEAAQYFSQISSSLYGEGGDIILARLSVSSCQHISKASINLLILKAITGQYKLHPIFQYFTLGSKQRQQNRSHLSYNETVWLVYLGIGLIFSGKVLQSEQIENMVMRFISCISDLNNFDKKPFYTLTIMRVFNQGVSSWKQYMQSKDIIAKLLGELFKIFFYYDSIGSIAADDKKFNFVFAKNDELLRKTMKQGIIRTIIYIGNTFQHVFHAALKNQTINQKIHSNYPASVIQILRQYIKSQKPSTNLVFYVELLLQCLSPMTPQLRKYVQKNALSTLQLMCTYKNISFNQPSQKLSVKTANHIYIYCLRTSTKWRTINLKDQKPFSGEALVEMSPNGTYIALLSDKLRIWRLSSGFWSGVLGAFSQDWVFQASGKALKWSQNQQSITVTNDNSSKNKVFKI